jgi:hypothetical protein
MVKTVEMTLKTVSVLLKMEFHVCGIMDIFVIIHSILDGAILMLAM